jgi:tetratricopeptide (TPR) repeat protein
LLTAFAGDEYMLGQLIDRLLSFYDTIGIAGVFIGLIIGFIIIFLYIFINNKFNMYRRAQKYYSRGNLRRALYLLSVVLHKKPSNKKALLLKADIECELEDYINAEKNYYRLIDLKKPGDGTDIYMVKKRLLKPVYQQDKIYAAFNLAKDILYMEKNNAEALYYLGLICLGQLYYKEASEILLRLIFNRPQMHHALFAYAVAQAQLNNFEKSLEYISQAVGVNDNPLYKISCASVYFLMENYPAAKRTLEKLPETEKTFENKRQYLFYLRLKAFCNYMQGSSKEATSLFRMLYKLTGKSKPKEKPADKSPTIYNEFGRTPSDSKPAESPREAEKNSALSDYFRLREIAMEEGRQNKAETEKYGAFKKFLDLFGLSAETRAALDVALSMVKSESYSQALDFLKEVKTQHPEVLGMGKVMNLLEERVADASGKDASGNGKDQSDVDSISSITEKVIERKERKYELWEYIREWEKNGIRPYHLLLVSGFTSKKQLSPFYLLNMKKNFNLDF